jgi:hypothetical protein
MEFSNVSGDVVAIRLPNGNIKVVKNSEGPVGEVFESDNAFLSKYQKVNESGVSKNVFILDSINE